MRARLPHLSSSPSTRKSDAGVREGVDFVGFSSETASSTSVDPAVPVVVATPGDTLRSIIAAHYGHVDDTLLAHVVKANGITNPDHIAIGQIIALPAVAAEIPDGAATWSSHQVVKGDTLWDILDAHYGYADADLVWHVANANGLKNPDELAIGQLITLPPVDTGAADSSVIEHDRRHRGGADRRLAVTSSQRHISAIRTGGSRFGTRTGTAP